MQRLNNNTQEHCWFEVHVKNDVYQLWYTELV